MQFKEQLEEEQAEKKYTLEKNNRTMRDNLKKNRTRRRQLEGEQDEEKTTWKRKELGEESLKYNRTTGLGERQLEEEQD
jgi:hypothetical protein